MSLTVRSVPFFFESGVRRTLHGMWTSTLTEPGPEQARSRPGRLGEPCAVPLLPTCGKAQRCTTVTSVTCRWLRLVGCVAHGAQRAVRFTSRPSYQEPVATQKASLC